MSSSVRTMMAAALALGGAMVLQPETATAQQGYHLYRNGVRVTGPAYVPYRQGFRAGYGGPRYGFGGGYGYRPAYYGPRYGYGYGYRPAYYGSRYYGGYYSPAYYTPARTCYVERRRVVNRYGRVGIRRVQTCY